MKTTTEQEPVGTMFNPPHPGEVLQGLWLEPLGLTITKTAEILGVSRKTVSNIVNAKIPISQDLAIRIAIAFKGRAKFWLDMQASYDAWHAEQNRERIAKEVTIVMWEQAA